MKVAVIGAGISGVMTAYFLSQSGCKVTVIEREAGPADSTSFGNGGVIGGTQVDPWAQPGLPMKLLRWIGHEDAPVLIRLGQIPKVMGWGLRFFARCNEGAVREALANNVRLTLFSLARFAELREREAITGSEYDLSRRGAYKLFFTDDAFAHALASADALASLGVEVEAITPQTASEREPALAPIARKLTGVLAFPREEVGDCRKFTRWMADRLARAGVDFRFGTEVKALRREGPRIVAASIGQDDVEADAFVVALASRTPSMLRPLGIKLPIIPVKGVSVTVPANPWKGALRSAVMDHSRLFGLIRIGDRLRVSGSAEVTGYDTVPSRARCQALVNSVLEIFPDFQACLDAEQPLYWAGLRGNTPDGVPVLGATPLLNLFVNAGHGPEGWSTSCGCARLVTDAVIGEKPAIDTAGLELNRFY